jgi:hypothetical protein
MIGAAAVMLRDGVEGPGSRHPNGSVNQTLRFGFDDCNPPLKEVLDRSLIGGLSAKAAQRESWRKPER